MEQLPAVFSEIFAHGEVCEQFYDEKFFPLDSDHAGNIWRLNSNADHLTRSKVLYHPSVVAKKNDDIRLCVLTETSKEIKSYEDANALVEIKKDAELKLKHIIQTKLTAAGLYDEPKMLCAHLKCLIS